MNIAPFANNFNDARVAITIADNSLEDCPLIYVNQEFENITEYSASQVIGTNCRFLQGQKTDQDPISKIRDAIAENTSTEVMLKNYKASGEAFNNFLTFIPLEGIYGNNLFLGCQFEFKLDTDRRAIISHLENLGRVLTKFDRRFKQTYDTMESTLKMRAALIFRNIAQ